MCSSDLRWISEHDLEIDPPRVLQLDSMDVEAAKRTRSIIMFLGPLLHQYETFKIPFAGGCSLGTRTVEPHMAGLVPFGLSVEAANDNYIATAKPQHVDRAIILTERGDTVTENVVMAVLSAKSFLPDSPPQQFRKALLHTFFQCTFPLHNVLYH